ncbi:hypothetical protein GUJ93_ZPchr0007g4639 [Zizania palustris]|uniref:Uncharacterized protein n=1 Tax=Zizania palustris TaxID=103762 RepID=A0A8J5W6K8_ZIZPA|nr:hypothetical protein GUJ93_ZPchr0007g4639 [Zizania palustris]
MIFCGRIRFSVARILVPQSVPVEEGEQRMSFNGSRFQSKIAMAAPSQTTTATHQYVLFPTHLSVEPASSILRLPAYAN